MTTYLVIWAGGNMPTAIDAFDNLEDAQRAYDAITEFVTLVTRPRHYVNLIKVDNGEKENLDGIGFFN